MLFYWCRQYGADLCENRSPNNRNMEEGAFRSALPSFAGCGNRKFLPDEVFQTLEEAQAAIAQWLHNWEAAAGEQACPIFLKEGACIGHIALSPLEDWDGEAWEVTCHIGALCG